MAYKPYEFESETTRFLKIFPTVSKSTMTNQPPDRTLEVPNSDHLQPFKRISKRTRAKNLPNCRNCEKYNKMSTQQFYLAFNRPIAKTIIQEDSLSSEMTDCIMKPSRRKYRHPIYTTCGDGNKRSGKKPNEAQKSQVQKYRKRYQPLRNSVKLEVTTSPTIKRHGTKFKCKEVKHQYASDSKSDIKHVQTCTHSSKQLDQSHPHTYPRKKIQLADCSTAESCLDYKHPANKVDRKSCGHKSKKKEQPSSVGKSSHPANQTQRLVFKPKINMPSYGNKLYRKEMFSPQVKVQPLETENEILNLDEIERFINQKDEPHCMLDHLDQQQLSQRKSLQETQLRAKRRRAKRHRDKTHKSSRKHRPSSSTNSIHEAIWKAIHSIGESMKTKQQDAPPISTSNHPVNIHIENNKPQTTKKYKQSALAPKSLKPNTTDEQRVKRCDAYNDSTQRNLTDMLVNWKQQDQSKLDNQVLSNTSKYPKCRRMKVALLPPVDEAEYRIPSTVPYTGLYNSFYVVNCWCLFVMYSTLFGNCKNFCLHKE